MPRKTHERTLVVRLTRQALLVAYRVELDAGTLIEDLNPFSDKIDFPSLTTAQRLGEVFLGCYAPVFADNLVAKLDDKPLQFTCVKQGCEFVEADNNFRCDFLFQAAWTPAPNAEHEFQFKEANYTEEAGRVRLSLEQDASVTIRTKSEPDEALKSRPLLELRPGDDARLRSAAAKFVLSSGEAKAPHPQGWEREGRGAETKQEPQPVAESEPGSSSRSLLSLLLDSRRGFWLLLGLAGCLGAVHALTPGHGKTLVAAYLVGEQGTVWHALVLGLVTTFTHTGIVLALAVGLRQFFPNAVPADVQMVLGVGGGLVIAGLGFWLLLRRLSGGADHFHLGGHCQHDHDLGHHHYGHGGHHHHNHSHADHDHDEQGRACPFPGPPRAEGNAGQQPVGLWGLVVLGINGGIVPCWDAVAMLAFAVSARRLGLALPLLLAFSAGLAAVLISIGILVVYAKGFAASRWGESRLFRSLPVISAALVAALGLWLCYESAHPGT